MNDLKTTSAMSRLEGYDSPQGVDYEKLDNYVLAHIDKEPELLKKLNRDTYVKIMRPRMLSGHLQGRILKMFVRMIRPRRVLELGTFTGYSALCIAVGLPEDGIVYTIDMNDELEEFTTSFFEQSPLQDKIKYLLGDAMATIPTIDETFDLVFIDADKREYLDYYRAVFDKVSAGGFIIADNTLWDGKVIENINPNDEQTLGVGRFNDFAAQDERVETVIIPLRDGMTILRKK
jgi:predicted O-methyltransferase YrrM